MMKRKQNKSTDRTTALPINITSPVPMPPTCPRSIRPWSPTPQRTSCRMPQHPDRTCSTTPACHHLCPHRKAAAHPTLIRWRTEATTMPSSDWHWRRYPPHSCSCHSPSLCPLQPPPPRWVGSTPCRRGGCPAIPAAPTCTPGRPPGPDCA